MSDHPTKQTTDDPWPENRARLEATFEGAAMLDKPITDAARCYLCRGEIGVYCWTDQKGKAHPWCADPAAWRPELKGRDVLVLRRCT